MDWLKHYGMSHTVFLRLIRCICKTSSERSKPESEQTRTVLTYHVVSGKFDAATVIDAIKQKIRKIQCYNCSGGTIVLSLNDGKVMLTDANGGTATVILADASNGLSMRLIQ
jgi:uncharacterized surface protein with fasciclin (FAS1) repeats